MSSDNGGEDFNESDNGLEDDDALFDINVDKGVEYGSLGSTCDPNDPEYAPVGNELAHLHDLADLDGESDDTEELDSGSSSDTDDGTVRAGKKKKTNPIFNENVDMVNPVFDVVNLVFNDNVQYIPPLL
ncbi:hypothetical protein RHGRI_027008 [Rhododendron griersonianum]|uniref:Uncharacterized protein n=1 Tax=Rhododendron griersonianum TaxID=479676 RepID=A0AAV6IVH2_9ERIC|nr:hypothetical protein RHGRI_027008 [Rhododendron griersonianum]